VLGNQLGLNGFDYLDSREVRDAAFAAIGAQQPDNGCGPLAVTRSLQPGSGLERIGGVPAYSVDATVRRAVALQQTPDAWRKGLRICAALADSLGLADGDTALLQQGDTSTSLPAWIDERVPDNCVWLPSAVPGAEILTAAHGSVTLEKA
jgi:NADH-quinone oxidoreductase subunit G